MPLKSISRRFVILLLTLVAAAVFEQHHFARSHLNTFSPVAQEGHRSTQQLAQAFSDRSQGVFGAQLPFGGATQVAGHHDGSETYYELLPKRIPGLQEPIGELQSRNILVDGRPGELLLQIFSENQLGPIFFEFIQRKGNEGFGEGNFKALFETMELDQMRRGVVAAPAPATEP